MGETEESTIPTNPDRRWTVSALIVLAIVLANAAFIGLGSVFSYPDILQEPPGEILTEFRADEGTIVALFIMLALSAALLAPIAVLLGRMADDGRGPTSPRSPSISPAAGSRSSVMRPRA